MLYRATSSISRKRPRERPRVYSASRKRPRSSVEDSSASFVRTFVLNIRRDLEDRGHGAEEVDALCATVSACAHDILFRWSRSRERKNEDARPSLFVKRAACVLARKAILGYDHEYEVAPLDNEAQYDSWIVEFLKSHAWKPCETVQRDVGELPPPQHAVSLL